MIIEQTKDGKQTNLQAMYDGALADVLDEPITEAKQQHIALGETITDALMLGAEFVTVTLPRNTRIEG